MKVLLRNSLLINLQNTFWRLLLSNIHKPISEYVLFFTICGKTFWAKAFLFAYYISYFIFFTVCKDKQTTDKDVFKTMSNIYNEVHCMKKCPHLEFFCYAFSRIWTEYGEILRNPIFAKKCSIINIWQVLK